MIFVDWAVKSSGIPGIRGYTWVHQVSWISELWRFAAFLGVTPGWLIQNLKWGNDAKQHVGKTSSAYLDLGNVSYVSCFTNLKLLNILGKSFGVCCRLCSFEHSVSYATTPPVKEVNFSKRSYFRLIFIVSEVNCKVVIFMKCDASTQMIFDMHFKKSKINEDLCETLHFGHLIISGNWFPQAHVWDFGYSSTESVAKVKLLKCWWKKSR